MQPGAVPESGPAPPGVRPWVPGRGAAPGAGADGQGQARADRRNLALIAFGFLALLLLIPPAHAYPIIDDWVYAGAVQHQLATGAFAMPAESQANLAGLVLWGTLWAGLFGFGYTTLTAATLALGFAGLLAFYGLARRVGVPPAGALLGTALLALNPLFLHLSYSFMTDVPFLALVLIACYCYVRGLQAGGPGWLVAGGLVAGWGFSVRQFAMLVPIAFAGYLLLEGLSPRRWRWRHLLLIAVAPVLIEAVWWLWTHDWTPTPLTQAADSRRANFMFKEPWLRVFLLRVLAAVPLTALSAWTAMTLRPARWWLIALWTGIVGWAWGAVNGLHEVWIGTTEPPFAFRVGPLAIDLPQQINTFIGLGSIVRIGGFDFFEYQQAPIWTPEAWRLIFVGTSILGVLLLAQLSAALLDFGLARFRISDFGFWIRSLRSGLALAESRRHFRLQSKIRNPKSEIAPAVYLAGFGIFGASLALGGDFYDRYVLGFVPFVILFAIRDARKWRRRAWAHAGAALAILALFSLLLERDFIAHDNARWQAAQWLAARAHPLHGGYDWDNTHGAGDGRYAIADAPIPGFRTEYAVPYQSWLTLSERAVLAQARADQPPLIAPVPGP